MMKTKRILLLILTALTLAVPEVWAKKTPYVLYCGSVRTLYFDYLDEGSVKKGDLYEGEPVTNMCSGDEFYAICEGDDPMWQTWVYEQFVEWECRTIVIKLETITGLEYLNTSQSENMERMFDGCEKLTSLNLSNFNTSKVRSMKFMFQNCAQLTTLDLSNFDVAHVTDMNGIFQGCSQLATLNISGLNPYNTTYMGYMFKDCVALTSLDLTSFETNSAKEMQYMFSGCTGLEKINISYGWYTGYVANSEGMFTGCTSLVGGNGTEYDASHTDKTYARGDEEESPGYLTYVPVEFTEERAMAV
ncbi:MAG: BspA family leucine-rich repeat surface protein [Prevotella sp.]|nr:BspA family leucine-rich repeat surface protein [Prevotella sp.]